MAAAQAREPRKMIHCRKCGRVFDAERDRDEFDEPCPVDHCCHRE